MARLLLSQDEAAERLGISISTLRRRINDGTITPVVVGARKKFTIAHLDQAMGLGEPEAIVPAPPLDPQETVYSRAKNGAGMRNIRWELSKAAFAKIVQRANGRCEVTDTEFRFEQIGGQNPFAASLDRIDNTKGYLPDNVRLVCFAVNLALNTWGDDVLRTLARNMIAKELKE